MNKAIILAAGQGTRLRPLTDEIPKTMVRICEKPIIEYQMDAFSKRDITEIHVVAGYKEEKLVYQNLIKTINHDFKSTNMVASLYLLRDLFDGTCDVVISYGDIIFDDIVLDSLMMDHCNEVSIVYDVNWLELWKNRMDNPLDDVETFRIDENQNVTELGSVPEVESDIQGQYIGLIFVPKSQTLTFFDNYDRLLKEQTLNRADFNNMYMTTYLQLLIDTGTKVKGIPIYSGWLEIDSLTDVENYNRMNKNKLMKDFCSTVASNFESHDE